MAYDFDATSLRDEANTLLLEAEALSGEGRLFRKDFEDGFNELKKAGVAFTIELDVRSCVQLRVILDRRAKLCRVLSNLEERCDWALSKKRDELDSGSAASDRQLVGLEDNNVFETTRQYHLEEIDRIEEARRTVDATGEILGRIYLGLIKLMV